ncbi:hypothetical protein ScPMuIL_008994 [Solemya velum]
MQPSYSRNGFPVFRLEDLDMTRFDQLWYRSFSARRESGTVKSYLHSLSLFLKFVAYKNLVEKDHIQKVLNGVKTILKVQERWVSICRSDLEALDFGTMISTDDVRTFLSSPLARETEALLTTMHLPPMTEKLYKRMRDYVILHILLSCGQRIRVFLNLTLGVLKNTSVGDMGPVTIVSRHKT